MILSEAGASPAPTLPIAEFAEHLRLGTGFPDDGSEDALLERYLRAAIAVIERRIATALIRRRFEIEVSHLRRSRDLSMPLGPVTAIVSATLVDGAAETPLATTAWRAEACEARPRLSLGGGVLPAGARVRIVFDAGLAADWDGVPGDLRQAVLLLAAEFYQRRGTEDVAAGGLPGPVLALLGHRRPIRL